MKQECKSPLLCSTKLTLGQSQLLSHPHTVGMGLKLSLKGGHTPVEPPLLLSDLSQSTTGLGTKKITNPLKPISQALRIRTCFPLQVLPHALNGSSQLIIHL